jgi:hypothetical protein
MWLLDRRGQRFPGDWLEAGAKLGPGPRKLARHPL